MKEREIQIKWLNFNETVIASAKGTAAQCLKEHVDCSNAYK